jgi:tetratricopeptide (TPR) repeat protein
LGPAVIVSPKPDVSISHATALLMGLGSFFAIANCDQGWRRPELGGVVLMIAGASMVLLSLIGTDWGVAICPFIGKITARLPLLVPGVSNLGGSGFLPNEVGGVLALLLPPTIAFVVLAWSRGRQPLMDRWQILAWTGWVVVFLMLGVLLLTESRTAILVVMFLGAAVVGWRRRGFGIIVLAVVIAASILLVIGLASGSLTEWLVSLDRITRSPDSPATAFPRRIEVWRNSVNTLRDYALVGNGLHAFSEVSRLNYVYEVVTPEDPAYHAHNLWLQIGTDMGLVGLCAFIWLTAMVLLLGWGALRRRRVEERTWLTGLWLGLLVWMGHGILDGVPLGSRSALIVWIMMGYLVAAWQGDPQPWSSDSQARQVRWAVLIPVPVILTVTALWLSGSPFWDLNRGATILDGTLLPDGRYADWSDRDALLSDAARTIGSVAGLPGALRRQALIHFEVGELEQATILFRQDPEVEGYLVSRATMMISEGALDKAQALLDVGLDVVEGSGRLTCLAGDIARLNGHLGEAREYYRDVPEMVASFDGRTERLAECFYHLARAERLLGRWDVAAEWFAVAADLRPQQLEYQLNYGLALFRATGDINQAAAIVEAVLETHPDAVDLMVTLADLYLEADRPQRSLEWSGQAVATAPGDPGTWLRLARAHMALEQWDEGRRALDEALRLDPEDEEMLALKAEWDSLQ